MKRKILVLLLVFYMLAAFLPCIHASQIVDSGTCGANVTWTLDDEGTLNISGEGEMSSYNLWDLAPWHDNYADKVKNVVVNYGVTSMGSYAFWDCRSLINIVIPESVTNISKYVFEGCSSLTNIDVALNNSEYCSVDGVLFNKEKVELICCPGGKSGAYIIPNSVISIGEYAFNGCSSLTGIIIPGSVTSIGEYAFYGCSSLTSAAIPEGVTNIGMGTFNSCSSLTGITIPDSVTSIGDAVFYNCSSLISVSIPEGVTSIGTGMFYGCSSLTDVTMPSSVTSIGNDSFNNCSSLTSVEIPNSITFISVRAFAGCRGLTHVTIPGSVTGIAGAAFWNCSSLKSIIMPSSVTSIEGSAFSNCSSLTDLYYSGTEREWNNIEINSYDNECLMNAQIHYNGVVPTPKPAPIPTTTAVITKSETCTAYTFEISPEEAYENCYVYLAIYAENGVLISVNRVPLEMVGNTNISIDKKDNASAAKVFIWADTLQPIIAAKEFSLI